MSPGGEHHLLERPLGTDLRVVLTSAHLLRRARRRPDWLPRGWTARVGDHTHRVRGGHVFAVVYRWRLHPGSEAQFQDGWERVTLAIRGTCGSFGSRLHRADDGTWVAYARWPDAATRDRCEFDEPEGERLMAESVAERFPELALELVSDLLGEPAGP